MDCTVTLWDSGFGNIKDPSITLVARSGGITLASLSNGTLSSGGGFGAILSFTSSKTIFDVEVDTWNTPYAPWIIQELNGDRITQEISVVLLTTPASSSSAVPPSPEELEGFLAEQRWTAEERRAVDMTILTLAYLRRANIRGRPRILNTCEAILARLHINPHLVGGFP
jgi:hypothetical protein